MEETTYVELEEPYNGNLWEALREEQFKGKFIVYKKEKDSSKQEFDLNMYIVGYADTPCDANRAVNHLGAGYLFCNIPPEREIITVKH